jgi:hypothetical protein
MSEVFFVEMCAVFSLKRPHTLFEKFVFGDVRAAARCNGAFPEPARYQVAMERIESQGEIAQHKFEAFYHCAITSNRIGAHNDTGHTVPYGTGLWGVALSQALRARLRS